MNTQKQTGIHCKVIWNDQIRRFQFSGTEFSLLQDQVKQLLGLNREFVLKYKDNEDDMITVSSTEELACAIDISKKNEGGLIRFTVFTSPEDQTFPIPFEKTHEHPFCRREILGGDVHSPHEHGRDVHSPHEHGRDFCRRGRGRGKWGGRWCREGGDFGGGEFQKNRVEKRKAKLTFKRDMFRAYLNTLEQAKDLSPEEEKKKLIFREKVNRLEQYLASFNSTPDSLKENDGSLEKQLDSPTTVGTEEDCLFERKQCHFEKKWRKDEYKQRKNKKEAKDSFLSEEAKAEIKTVQGQIRERKPALWAIQAQIKEKKFALKGCVENEQPQKVQQLKKDIEKLKREKREKKAELVPLRQRLFQLKTGKI